jgi:uncharacterized protein (DUF1697 family)
MPRFVAFLRGVSPLNAKMPELKRCFEDAGFTDVRTLLSSGNVAFTSRTASTTALERKIEAAMMSSLGRTFGTFVHSAASLQAMLAADPFASFAIPADGKRVVTFLRAVPAGTVLPPERDGARILLVAGSEAYTVYTPTPKGPVFMTLLHHAFGADITTRTWDTIRKCAVA